MNINSEDFKIKLKELCDNNWKAKEIMRINNNDFRNLPEHQKKMFLKAMQITEVDVTIGVDE